VLQLTVEITERGPVTVVAVAGELDLGSAPRLRDAAVRRLLAGDRALVLDLRGLEFIDSTGLGTVVAVLKRARSLGADLRLVITRPRIADPFALTGIDGVLPIHADLEAAVLAGEGAAT
jgi:anti-sigma B factor antagonist